MPDVNLSNRELQLIKEALLYCISPDLDHTRYQEDLIDSLELLVKLRMSNSNVPVTNIVFVKDLETSQFTSEILKFFPDIQKI